MKNSDLHENYQPLDSLVPTLDKDVKSYRCCASEEIGNHISVIGTHPLRPRKTRNKFVRSLRELDDTVTSIGNQYRSGRRAGCDEDSSVSSHSIATNESHSFPTHRDLIDNIQEMKSSARRPSAVGSLSSRSGRASRRSRISITSSRSRRRGLSLERTISRMILEAAAWGDALFVTSPEESIVSNTSTDFILQDLDQACSIIGPEAGSIKSSGSSRQIGMETGRARKLLPTVVSYTSENDSIDSGLFPISSGGAVIKDQERCLSTPDTSDETSVEQSPGRSTSQDKTSTDPFLDIDDDDFPTIDWPQAKKIPHADAEKWTTFDANPFVAQGPSVDDHRHTESPSSIADFEDFPRSWKNASTDPELGTQISI